MTTTGIHRNTPADASPGCGTAVDARPCSPGRTFMAVAVFYAAALLLNADGLHRGASRLPYGPLHSAATAAIRPVQEVARVFRLTTIRSLVERISNATINGESDE